MSPITTHLIMSASPNGARVKLYSFSETHNWDEIGTGHVTLQYVDRLQGLSMIVRSEDDGTLNMSCASHMT